MNNAFDTMRQALSEAADANRAADHFSNRMAQMLISRLHHVDSNTLMLLKRELTRFDAHRKAWKT